MQKNIVDKIKKMKKVIKMMWIKINLKALIIEMKGSEKNN